MSPRADDLAALSGWRCIDASELETLRGAQCKSVLTMPTIGEVARCVRQAGHEQSTKEKDRIHWCDLSAREAIAKH